jgi:hypothetical protein
LVPCGDSITRWTTTPAGNYLGKPCPSTRLFWHCFKLQREAGIPLIVENVKGAERFVGSARWHYGSYYLWGDVPALMPITLNLRKRPGRNFHAHENGLGSSPMRGPRTAAWCLTPRAGAQAIKNNGGSWFAQAHNTDSGHSQNPVTGEAVKQGGEWWHDPTSMTRKFSSRSHARKAASAQIAKIPFELAAHIARVFYPR